MTIEQIQNQIRAFIVEQYLEGEVGDFDVSTPLFGLGILDSRKMPELLSYLEGTFDVRIDDGEVAPTYLSTVSAIASLVDRKRTEGSKKK